MKKVVTSAVIVSPPKDTWNPIQEIRVKHDKAYARWMPHINLLYPFYPESQFSAVLPKVREALAGISPFTVTFDSFDLFEHGASSCTLFLHPTVQPPNALRDLQAALFNAFPDCDEQSTKSPEGFHAHLTVGQFKGKSLAQRKKTEFSRNWKPITWRVDSVQLISRTATGPFEVSHTVPLGVPVQPQVVALKPVARVQTAATQPRQPPPSRERTGPKEIPKPGTAEEVVVERLTQWIAYNAALPKASLPKTKAKLRSAIKPMCSVKVKYLEVDEVVKQLEQEGYVRVLEGDKLHFPKKQAKAEADRLSTNTYIARDSYRLANESHKEPTKIVMARCKEWVEAPLNTPTTRAALKNSLQQLCIMPEEVECDKAMQLLEARGLIIIDNDDKVTYP